MKKLVLRFGMTDLVTGPNKRRVVLDSSVYDFHGGSRQKSSPLLTGSVCFEWLSTFLSIGERMRPSADPRGDLHRLFAPRAKVSSYDQSGRSRLKEGAPPVGG